MPQPEGPSSGFLCFHEELPGFYSPFQDLSRLPTTTASKQQKIGIESQKGTLKREKGCKNPGSSLGNEQQRWDGEWECCLFSRLEGGGEQHPAFPREGFAAPADPGWNNSVDFAAGRAWLPQVYPCGINLGLHLKNWGNSHKERRIPVCTIQGFFWDGASLW